MRDDDWKIVALAVLLSIMWCEQCFCSPPSSWLVAPKIKTEITFEQPLNPEKWTKLHLRATALNYWMPHYEGKLTVSIRGDGIIAKRSDKKWNNPKYGDVFTTDFLIRPYKNGGINLGVSYSICGTNYFFVIRPDLSVENIGSYYDIWKKYVQDTSQEMQHKVETGYAYGVYDTIVSHLPASEYLPLNIDSSRIVLYRMNSVYTINRPIGIHKKTEFELRLIDADNEYHQYHEKSEHPVLLVRRNDTQTIRVHDGKAYKQDSLIVFYEKKEDQYIAVMEIEPTLPGKTNRLVLEERWMKDGQIPSASSMQRTLYLDFDSNGILKKIGTDNDFFSKLYDVSE